MITIIIMLIIMLIIIIIIIIIIIVTTLGKSRNLRGRNFFSLVTLPSLFYFFLKMDPLVALNKALC